MRHRVLLLFIGLVVSSLCTVRHADGLHYYRQAKPGEPKLIECDVLVYGGTPAGVAAAFQAGDMGKKVLFVSFNRHVGGLSLGGLAATDIGKADSVGGIARKFYTRAGQHRRLQPITGRDLVSRDARGSSALMFVLSGRLTSVE